MCPQSNLAGCTQLCKHTAHSKIFPTAPSEEGTRELVDASSLFLRACADGDDLDAMTVFRLFTLTDVTEQKRSSNPLDQ